MEGVACLHQLWFFVVLGAHNRWVSMKGFSGVYWTLIMCFMNVVLFASHHTLMS